MAPFIYVFFEQTACPIEVIVPRLLNKFNRFRSSTDADLSIRFELIFLFYFLFFVHISVKDPCCVMFKGHFSKLHNDNLEMINNMY